MSEDQNTLAELKGFDDYDLSLGDELRGERATLGKSLLDVQRDLRIKAAYIAAIENCDPSVFPNQGFIAGYVRSYGRYLKLDPDKMFDRFCKESGFQGVNAGMITAKKRQVGPPTGPFQGAEVTPRFANDRFGTSDNILNVISPSGIASAVVLTLLIGGLGLGGWKLLNDLQRVEFAPIDQSPSAAANSPAFETSGFDIATGVDVPNSAQEVRREEETLLGRLYRPQELSVPKLQPRDGPIASIDPDTVGVLKPEPLPDRIPTISESVQQTAEAISTLPVVSIDEGPPVVQLYATRAAWVRVHYEDGTVLFEKILEKGEFYTLPEDAENPLLRAGNSGSVYVVVDNQPFGPVGNGTAVAKQVSLLEQDVKQAFAAATDLDLAPEVESAVSSAESQ